LISTSLSVDNTFLVIRTDPWQYDNHDDVRGTLIAEILDEIRTRFDSEGDVTDRVTELRKRISWNRVDLAVGKGVLSMGWNTSGLIDAFKPKKRSEPESMSGFKDAFASLLKILPNIKRVVILVDLPLREPLNGRIITPQQRSLRCSAVCPPRLPEAGAWASSFAISTPLSAPEGDQIAEARRGIGEFRRSSQRWAFRVQTVDVAWLLPV
jgi:hypothetical protein